MSLKPVRAALALGLGLAAAIVGPMPATAVDAGPVRLAVAVPLVVPGTTTGLLDADALEQYTKPLGLLTRQLDAVIDRQVAIGIDPLIIVSIRVLGTAAPPTAVAWLDRLAGATNEIFPLAYADFDITLATQAGSSSVPQPESFDFAVDPGLFAPQTTETPAPAPTDAPEPQLPPYPSTADLLAWPYSLTGLAWPREDSVVASDLAAIAASNYSTIILSSNNLDTDTDAGPSAEVGDERILVSDASVSATLRAATHALTPEERQSTIAALTGSVAAAGAAQTGEQSTIFATLDRTIPTSNSHLADALTALESDPAITLIPVSQAIGASPSPAAVVDKPQDAAAVAQVARMLDAEAADRLFASVAEDPGAITADRRLKLLALTSAGWESNPTGWNTAAEGYLAASVELRNAIAVVESSSFTLRADLPTSLPITVSNALDQEVTVYITVRPETAQLAVGDSRVELVIEPGAQAKGQIPIQAISNGVVRVDVSLASASGVPIGPPTYAEINVQAGWETPIVIVLAGIVVVVFGVGIVRNILRRRRPADD